MYKRKTMDVWRIYVNYGKGWEHECTETSLADMKANREAYRRNCAYPIRVRRGRERIDKTDY